MQLFPVPTGGCFILQEGFFVYLPSLKQWVKQGLTIDAKEKMKDSDKGETLSEPKQSSVHSDDAKAHPDASTNKDTLPEALSTAVETSLEDGFENSLGGISTSREKAPEVVPLPLNGFGSTKSPSSAATATEKKFSPAVTFDACHSFGSNERDGESDTLLCELKNRAIICPHGKLDPEEARNTRVVSAVCPHRSGLMKAYSLRCRRDCEF